MLSRLTIKSRLILLVALLSSLMCLLGVGAIFALGNAAASLRTVYNDRLVPMGQLDRVIRLVNRNQLSLSTAFINGPGSYAESLKAVQEAEQEAMREWRAYSATWMTED